MEEIVEKGKIVPHAQIIVIVQNAAIREMEKIEILHAVMWKIEAVIIQIMFAIHYVMEILIQPLAGLVHVKGNLEIV